MHGKHPRRSHWAPPTQSIPKSATSPLSPEKSKFSDLENFSDEKHNSATNLYTAPANPVPSSQTDPNPQPIEVDFNNREWGTEPEEDVKLLTANARTIFERLPTGVRAALTDTLGDVFRCITTGIERGDATKGIILLLSFPSRALVRPFKAGKEMKKEIIRNIRRFKHLSASNSIDASSRSGSIRIRKRAEYLIQNGDHTKARKLLECKPPVTPTKDQAKAAVYDDDTTFSDDPASPLEGVPKADDGMIHNVMDNECKFLKAADVYGWRGTLLKHALDHKQVRDGIVVLVNAILTNNPALSKVRHLLTAGRMLMISKTPAAGAEAKGAKPVSLRPITISPLFTKIAAKGAANLLKAEVKKNNCLEPLQFCCSPSGIESIAQQVQLLLSVKSHRLVATDLKKAYDSMSRKRILNILKTKFNNFVRVYRFLYAQTTLVSVRTNDNGLEETTVLENKTGVLQGNPLSTLLFALGLQEAVEKFDKKLPKGAIVLAYADDVFALIPVETDATVWSKEVITDTLDGCLKETNVKVTLKMEKTKVFDPLTQINGGMNVLGFPVGSVKFQEASLRKSLIENIELMDKVVCLKAQPAMSMMRMSVVPGVLHLTRVNANNRLYTEYDNTVRDAVLTIMRVNEWDIHEAQKRVISDHISLPTRLCGFGLHRVNQVSAAALLRSLAASLPTFHPDVKVFIKENFARVQECSRYAELNDALTLLRGEADKVGSFVKNLAHLHLEDILDEKMTLIKEGKSIRSVDEVLKEEDSETKEESKSETKSKAPRKKTRKVEFRTQKELMLIRHIGSLHSLIGIPNVEELKTNRKEEVRIARIVNQATRIGRAWKLRAPPPRARLNQLACVVTLRRCLGLKPIKQYPADGKCGRKKRNSTNSHDLGENPYAHALSCKSSNVSKRHDAVVREVIHLWSVSGAGGASREQKEAVGRTPDATADWITEGPTSRALMDVTIRSPYPTSYKKINVFERGCLVQAAHEDKMRNYLDDWTQQMQGNEELIPKIVPLAFDVYGGQSTGVEEMIDYLAKTAADERHWSAEDFRQYAYHCLSGALMRSVAEQVYVSLITKSFGAPVVRSD